MMRLPSLKTYPLVNVDTTKDNHDLNMGKSTISTGPFSMALLNYQRVSLVVDEGCIKLTD